MVNKIHGMKTMDRKVNRTSNDHMVQMSCISYMLDNDGDIDVFLWATDNKISLY